MSSLSSYGRNRMTPSPVGLKQQVAVASGRVCVVSFPTCLTGWCQWAEGWWWSCSAWWPGEDCQSPWLGNTEMHQQVAELGPGSSVSGWVPGRRPKGISLHLQARTSLLLPGPPMELAEDSSHVSVALH